MWMKYNFEFIYQIYLIMEKKIEKNLTILILILIFFLFIYFDIFNRKLYLNDRVKTIWACINKIDDMSTAKKKKIYIRISLQEKTFC